MKISKSKKILGIMKRDLTNNRRARLEYAMKFDQGKIIWYKLIASQSSYYSVFEHSYYSMFEHSCLLCVRTFDSKITILMDV